MDAETAAAAAARTMEEAAAEMGTVTAEATIIMAEAMGTAVDEETRRIGPVIATAIGRAIMMPPERQIPAADRAIKWHVKEAGGGS